MSKSYSPVKSAPTDAPKVCIELNEEWIAFLVGILYPFQFPEQWDGTLEENRNARQYTRQLLDLLSEAIGCDMAYCCDEINLTLNPLYKLDEAGRIQVSTDNGATWSNSPKDPTYLAPSVPPITSRNGKTKCNSVSNIVQECKNVQEKWSGYLGTATTLIDFIILAIEAVLAALLAVVGAEFLEFLVPLFGVFLKGLWGYTPQQYDALFTQDVWDSVMCMLYCTTDANGEWDDNTFAEVLTRCLTDIPGGTADFSAAQSILAMFKMWGVRGTNYIGATGVAVLLDCNTCNCDSCSFVNWSIGHGTLISQTSQHIVLDTELINGKYHVAIYANTANICCCNISATNDHNYNAEAIGVTYCGNPVGENVDYSYLGGSINYYAMRFAQPCRVTFSGLDPAECP